jgi:hypothetical protein
VGLRVVPAPVATRHYPEDEARLSAEIAAAERAWLAAQWTTDHGTRWEIRYTNTGPERTVSCVLLGRVHGRDLATVRSAALALRDRLAMTPRHIQATPIMDADEVRAALAPDRLDQNGRFELRKRLTWAWSGRRGADRVVCFAMAPLVAGDQSWEPVWDALVALPTTTTIGVYLEPFHPSDVLAEKLRRLAVEYADLATESPSSPVWPTSFPADPFAITAAPGYLEAARRYTGRCYRSRISVAAQGPIDPGFVELLATTAGGAVVCRPAPSDAATAWRNLATLDREWLDETYRQGSPAGELKDAERILCDIVDLTEASATLRFPSPVTVGGLEAPIPDNRTAPDTQRKRIFVSYVKEDLELVSRLVLDLRTAGYEVWIDRTRLRPGRRWKSEIKKAIADGDYFVACFSPNYWKQQTYMNEELIYAVERLRLMPRNRDWFIPAMLTECEIPDHAIGPNETLADSMQYADFGKDWDEALHHVIDVLGPPEK